jgi:hypothetical protein
MIVVPRRHRCLIATSTKHLCLYSRPSIVCSQNWTMPSEDESSDVVAPAIPSSDVALIKALLSDDDDTVEAGDVRRQFACITAIYCSRVRGTCLFFQCLLKRLFQRLSKRLATRASGDKIFLVCPDGLSSWHDWTCNSSQCTMQQLKRFMLESFL